MVSGAGGDGVPAKFSSPRSSSPRSMATLLTSVETPFGGESCASWGAGGREEVFSRESVTGRASGMSEAAMEGVMERGYRERRRRSRGAWTPGERTRFVLHIISGCRRVLLRQREQAGGLFWRSPYPYHKTQLRIPRSEVGVLRRPGLAFLSAASVTGLNYYRVTTSPTAGQKRNLRTPTPTHSY